MQCSTCGHQNRPGAKFCEQCAAPLRRSCANCGAELRPTAKFCDECGADLQAAQGRGASGPRGSNSALTPNPVTPNPIASIPLSAARKIVTIIFADLVGSTALHERLDPESVRHFMESYYAAMRAAVEACGGVVTQLLGDGVKAVFGAPRIAEDDAIRAVRAAVAMQQAFRALAEQQSSRVGKTGLRVAVNTGEVVADEATEIIGDPVNVAARLQEQGRDGDVVIGESTQRLVSQLVTLELLGTFALKGRAEPVKAYRVVSLARPAVATATAFVGRDEELARLTAVYDRAAAAPGARLAVLLGSPGLGKSRLIDELGRRLGARATVIAAQCDAAGGGTFAPLAAALRRHFAVDAMGGAEALRIAIETALPPEEPDRARIAAGVAALLLGSPAPPEETFFVVRRLLAAIASAKPMMLVIDDLHWAEPLLLDLVEHLIQWGSGVPLLVLVGARPELRDTRASLTAAGGLVTEVVTLDGLDAGAATRLAANVIGATDLPAAVAAKLLATSEGNPLFVAELARMLVQEGALTRAGDRWIVGAGLAALEMPPTIHALLAARIERLRPEERAVLERAAVIGRSFSRNAIAALLAPREASDLDARLESLKRSELIESDSGWFLGEPVLRFHHVLIRDAAYRGLLKGTRAELHARFAEWVEARTGEAAEHDETIGWHLEQAHQHLLELGPLDAQGRSLGERAAQRLAAAGRRALAGDDVPLAAGLLGRAIERLDGADPARAELALDWCEALLAAGNVGPATNAIAELARFIPKSNPVTPNPVTPNPLSPNPRLQAWYTCFGGQLTVLTEPQALQATGAAVAAAAVEFAALGDAAGEAKAHQVHAQALARLGKMGACEAALDRALAAARKAGDRRRANAVLAGAPLAALWGPSPVTRASGRCLDVVRVLRITQGAPAVESVALSCQGLLEALRGRTDAGRRMIAASRKMVEDLGIIHRLLEADAFAGRIDLLEGETDTAARALRGAYEGLRDLGLGIDAARAAALLARALLAQGKAAEAEALSRESEALAGDDLQAAIAWRGVRAEALAQRGEHGAAIELAQAAVAIAAATDALLDHADARLALAAALRAAGQNSEADAETRRAIELWETKGATLLAERVRGDAKHVHSLSPQAETRVEPTRPGHRRVRTNAATAALVQFDAAFAAADVDAVAALHAPSFEEIDHLTEVTYGREAMLASLRRTLRSREPRSRSDVLGTLGDSLTLTRRWIATSGTSGGRFDVAEAEREWLALVETDHDGRFQRNEVFAPDHLGRAVAGLYTRYAARLPDGVERARAEVTARAVTYILTDWVAPDPSLLFAPTLEDVDHRSVGYGTLSVGEARQLVASFRELADNLRYRVDDILALRPDGFVRKTTASGVWRNGGGAFARSVCMLSQFGADGRCIRQETFDSDRDVEALARFDELTAAPGKAARRLRANAALVAGARLNTAIAAHDAVAAEAVFSESLRHVDHTTGTIYGRAGVVASLQALLHARDPGVRHEPLASLGESLCVMRGVTSAAAVEIGGVDVGAYQMEQIGVAEVNGEGRIQHIESFAADHLGDAVARLYARYAEQQPTVAARRRATATAAAVAAMVAPPDLRRYASALAPSVEFKDHRTIGFSSGRGATTLLRGFRSLLELADHVATRVDDILGLEAGGLLLRWTTSGTDRRSGGAFESSFLLLWVFGVQGLIIRDETFDAEREAEALIRFDELVRSGDAGLRPTLRRAPANAASRLAARFQASFAAGDTEALGDLFAGTLDVINHPNAASYGRDGHLASVRRLRQARDPQLRFEPLATLGEALSLSRRFIRAHGVGGRFDVGEYEQEEIVLFETDAAARCRLIEVFADDHLGDAVHRLYERYAAYQPLGSGRDRAATVARSAAALLGHFDLQRFATAIAPTLVVTDHRRVGSEPTHSADAWLAGLRALTDRAADLTTRIDDVLALRADAILLRWMYSGTDRRGGGPYEQKFLWLGQFGAAGLLARLYHFDPEHEEEALACFDALAGGGSV